jgi:hypothetical protein
VDQGFFYETVAPLLLVGVTSLICISTLTSDIKYAPPAPLTHVLLAQAFLTCLYVSAQFLHQALQNQGPRHAPPHICATAGLARVHGMQGDGNGGAVQAHASFGSAVAEQHSA